MRGLLLENLGLKLLSLGVAMLLWMATVGDPNMTALIGVPVQYQNIPPKLEISSELIHSAQVELRGSRRQLSAENLANVAVMVDLAGVAGPGERTVSILAENVSLPAGVRFLRAIPAQIRLRLEEGLVREVPVLVRYAEPAPEGFRFLRQQVKPSTVRIVGPASRVAAIDHVQTDPVALVALEGESLYQVHAYAGDPHVRPEQPGLTIEVKVWLEKSR